MAIRYKVIEKCLPAANGAVKNKKFYASAIPTNELTLDDLTTEIGKISRINGAILTGALYALVEVIIKCLSNGQTVRLGDIGSLRVSISSEGKEKEEEVSRAAIKKSKIIYAPGKKLKQMLNTLEYKKEKTSSRNK